MSSFGESSLSLTAVVPIYNEIELVERSIREIAAFVDERLPSSEILLIESGSTDGSAEACDRLALEIGSVRVLHETERRGFGSAIRLGLREATRDLVWILPADQPFALDTIFRAVPLLRDADAVLSYRSEGRGGVFRRVQSAVYNRLVKSLLGLPVRSVNSAFKVYRRSAIGGCDLRSNGWFIDAEILFCLQRRGARCVEIPVPVLDRTAGRSTVTAFDPVRVLVELARFRLRGRR